MSFWVDKSLSEMTAEEWELLCDGCGKCCLNKLIDDDTEELYYTNAACKLLDHESCQCTHYPDRKKIVPECLTISMKNIAQLDWLPDSCAYRRLFLGKTLPSWHPLVVGNTKLIHQMGHSIKNKVVCESKVVELEDHIVAWPLD